MAYKCGLLWSSNNQRSLEFDLAVAFDLLAPLALLLVLVLLVDFVLT
jgi:hypothetical protein